MQDIKFYLESLNVCQHNILLTLHEKEYHMILPSAKRLCHLQAVFIISTDTQIETRQLVLCLLTVHLEKLTCTVHP